VVVMNVVIVIVVGTVFIMHIFLFLIMLHLFVVFKCANLKNIVNLLLVLYYIMSEILL